MSPQGITSRRDLLQKEFYDQGSAAQMFINGRDSLPAHLELVHVNAEYLHCGSIALLRKCFFLSKLMPHQVKTNEEKILMVGHNKSHSVIRYPKSLRRGTVCGVE